MVIPRARFDLRTSHSFKNSYTILSHLQTNCFQISGLRAKGAHISAVLINCMHGWIKGIFYQN